MVTLQAAAGRERIGHIKATARKVYSSNSPFELVGLHLLGAQRFLRDTDFLDPIIIGIFASHLPFYRIRMA